MKSIFGRAKEKIFHPLGCELWILDQRFKNHSLPFLGIGGKSKRDRTKLQVKFEFRMS